MTKCVVDQCQNNTGGRKSPGVIFFFFPADEHLKQAWMQALRMNTANVKNLRICSEHFDKSQLLQGLAQSGRIKPFLTVDAIPKTNDLTESYANRARRRSSVNMEEVQTNNRSALNSSSQKYIAIPQISNRIPALSVQAKTVGEHSHCKLRPIMPKKRSFPDAECTVSCVKNVERTEKCPALDENELDHDSKLTVHTDDITEYGLRDTTDIPCCDDAHVKLQEKYVMVEQNQLLKLCKVCLGNECLAPVNTRKVFSIDAAIAIQVECTDRHVSQWFSSEKDGKWIPQIDLDLAASILYTVKPENVC